MKNRLNSAKHMAPSPHGQARLLTGKSLSALEEIQALMELHNVAFADVEAYVRKHASRQTLSVAGRKRSHNSTV